MRALLSLLLSVCLVFEQTAFAQAIDLSHYFSRNPSQNLSQSDKFRPLHLRYISYDRQANDFRVLLDKGDAGHSTPKLDEATRELMKYFFIGLALPNDKFWVNLRPDSPDNILDPDLEKTDIGRVFLEADLQLKKDTSSFTSPQTPEGKAYWDKLYNKAGELFGSQNIAIPTITRPWIVPNEIVIREAPDNAYIYKAILKVMLEEDYLDNQKTEKPKNIKTKAYTFQDPRLKELNEYSTQLIKEAIIPKLTYEVNTSKRYAPLRQVYYSLILAQWFKQKYGSSGSARGLGILPVRQAGSAPVNSYIDLIDSRNLANLISSQSYDKQAYFQQYQKSFKDGEYSLQEPVYTPTGQVIRRYMSGGITMLPSASSGIPKKEIPAVGRPYLQKYLFPCGVSFNREITVSSSMNNWEDGKDIYELFNSLKEALKETIEPDYLVKEIFIYLAKDKNIALKTDKISVLLDGMRDCAEDFQFEFNVTNILCDFLETRENGKKLLPKFLNIFLSARSYAIKEVLLSAMDSAVNIFGLELIQDEVDKLINCIPELNTDSSKERMYSLKGYIANILSGATRRQKGINIKQNQLNVFLRNIFNDIDFIFREWNISGENTIFTDDLAILSAISFVMEAINKNKLSLDQEHFDVIVNNFHNFNSFRSTAEDMRYLLILLLRINRALEFKPYQSWNDDDSSAAHDIIKKAKNGIKAAITNDFLPSKVIEIEVYDIAELINSIGEMIGFERLNKINIFINGINTEDLNQDRPLKNNDKIEIKSIHSASPVKNASSAIDINAGKGARVPARRETGSGKIGGGWKLHLTVSPGNCLEVYNWLYNDKEGGYEYKLWEGGEIGEKDFTIYVGGRDEAIKYAQYINANIGTLLEKSNASVTDELLPGTDEKVAGRFDVQRTQNGGYGYSYYGFRGIPFHKKDLGLSTSKEEIAAENISVLTQYYGEFFSGKEYPVSGQLKILPEFGMPSGSNRLNEELANKMRENNKTWWVWPSDGTKSDLPKKNDEPDELDVYFNGSLSSSPAVISEESAVGGIAFNALPIQTEAVASSALAALPGVRAFKGDLEAEWAQIQAVFNAGIRPSAQRLADWTAAACASPLDGQRREDILKLIAELLRRDEEDKRLISMDLTLKNLLNALEATL